jgi:acetoin utilization deacetylase AcuC-like enzyme
MTVVVANHESALRHDTGINHPERPDRVRAVQRGIQSSGVKVVPLDSPEISVDQLAVVHDDSYIEMIRQHCLLGGGALDMDTFTSRASWEAALTAAGGVLAVVEELGVRSDSSGFVIARPPGHHALRDQAMGFCLFNNVAVSAALLRGSGSRVAILDWDVHHGNGTQALLGQDPSVLYVSLHQAPFYPYAGHVEDIHLIEAEGSNVNIPVPAGTGGDVYRRAWGELVMPVVRQFEPDWVFVSAGYDAHIRDPLGELALVADDYGWMAASLVEEVPSNRVVVVLEGGYDLEALEQSTASTLVGLSGISNWGPVAVISPEGANAAVDAAAAAISEYWSI